MGRIGFTPPEGDDYDVAESGGEVIPLWAPQPDHVIREVEYLEEEEDE